MIQHAEVLLHLELFELGNNHGALEDSDEVQQLVVVFNFHVQLLNTLLVLADIFLNGFLGFKQAFESGLSH